MQIEVVDDHSMQDDPEAIVREMAGDRVSFYRQPRNVGHTKNFQTCLERSRGKLIHLLHGDDCVRGDFYRLMAQGFKAKPEIGAAFCRHIIMDENGHWQLIAPLEQLESGILNNWLDKIAIRQRIQTPSIVVQRAVYEKLGGFDSRLTWAEDWEMWVRIASEYSIWYEVEPLALYRVHSLSSSGNRTRTGENIQDVRRAIGLIKHYLTNESADRLSNAALENAAFEALHHARQFASDSEHNAAINQIKEALRCRASLKLLITALKLYVRVILHKKLQKKDPLNLPVN